MVSFRWAKELAFLTLVSSCADDYAAEGETPVDGGTDGPGSVIRTDSSTEEDAGDGGPPTCDRTKPFGTPQPIAGLAALLAGVTLTADERRAFAVATVDSSTRIVELARPTRDAPFSLLRTLSAWTNGRPTISHDGLRLAFNAGSSVMLATRASIDADFGTPAVIASMSSASFGYSSPFLVPAGIYATRYESSPSLDYDLVFSELGVGGYAAPAVLTTLATDEWEQSPVATNDELTLYLRTRRNVDGGVKSGVFRATRASLGDAFGALTFVDGLLDADSTDVSPTWVSPDECRLYVMQTAGGGLRARMATR